jgi:hypothetical protein
MERITMVDRAAAHWGPIGTLRQKLAALAVAEADKDNVFLQERSRHCATEADKDKTDKAKGAPTLDDMRERTAALLRGMNNPIEG